MIKVIKKIEERELQLPICLVSLMITVLMGFWLVGSDMQMILRWYLVLLILGIVGLPITNVTLGEFGNLGYVFSKVIGLFVTSFIMWLLSFWHILEFSLVNCIVVVGIFGILIYCISFAINHNKGDASDVFGRIIGSHNYSLDKLITFEIAFLLIFVLINWYLGQHIPGNGTERLMNISFMKSIDKSVYMSPYDSWAANECINYYYFGHYMMTFLSKLSFVDVYYGYSLAMAMIMSVCIIASFAIVYKLIDTKYTNKKISVIAGTLATLAVTFAGNFHYFIYYKIVPTLWDMMGVTGDKPSYWFPESTRYIGHNPAVSNDMTIEEFPIYSFLIGDLHAHVIDIISVLLCVAVIVTYSLNVIRINKEDKADKEKKLLARMFNPNIILLGFVISIMSMTNYWDCLIYFVVAGAVILISNLLIFEGKLRAVALTLLQGAIVFIISKIVSLPFMLSFEKMINGIGVVSIRSKFYQLAILWGIPITTVILFVAFLYVGYIEYGRNFANNCEMAPNDESDIVIVTNKESNCMIRILNYFSSDRFNDAIVLILGLCAIGLIVLPEFIFVKDIYIDNSPRANTMFKLTYQAFILFGMVMSYVFVRIIVHWKRLDGYLSRERYRWIKNGIVICIVCFILTLGYVVTSSRMWIGEFKAWKYEGLDASSTILNNAPSDKAAVEWINDNIPGNEVILTTYGDSYTDSCIISAMTGHPTIVGWRVHEWLWHNGYDFVADREKEVDEIYTGTDIERKRELCEKYNVDYIYVGNEEYAKYITVDLEGLQSLGTIAYYNNDYMSYVIKIDK